MIGLQHLRAFVAVADTLHFGRAAEGLHVAQPWLSRQIRQLEADLGVSLLERTTRRVALTPAGEQYLPHARSALRQVEEGRSAARRAALGEAGRLSVGFTGAATFWLLPVVASRFRRHLPDVDLDLQGPVFSDEQIRMLADGRLDVGLVRLPTTPVDGVETELLLDEQLVAVLPEHHPLADRATVDLADLAREPFVAYQQGRGSALRAALERACGEAGFRPSVAQEAPDSHTLVALVGAGLGVSLVPASLTHLRLPHAVFRPLSAAAGAPMGLAYRAVDANPVTAQFLPLARAVLGERATAPADDLVP